jgi:hypothetical protein
MPNIKDTKNTKEEQILVDFDDVVVRTNDLKLESKSEIEIIGEKKSKIEEIYGFSLKNKSFSEIRALFDKSLNRDFAGQFDFHTNGNSSNIKTNKKGKVHFENIIENLENIYKNKNLSQDSVIQVETSLNSTLYNDLESYFNDNSYQTLAPYGLAHRHYLVNNINMLYDFLAFLKNKDNSINFKFNNNVLSFDSEDDLRKINRILGNSMDYRRNARSTILSCYQENQKIIDSEHHITNVFCPKIQFNLNPELWTGIVELLLEAYYENTLTIAHILNKKTCYLIPISESCVNKKQIARAIQRACHIASLRGYHLNVKLLHNNDIDDCYNIPANYPLNNVDVDSVWDSEWLYNAK